MLIYIKGVGDIRIELIAWIPEAVQEVGLEF
jgi:hypothetical protein